MEPNPASNVPDIDYTPPQPIDDTGSGTGKKVFVGCSIGCLVLLIVIVVAAIVVVKMGVNTALEFTEEEPIEFATPTADQATVDDVKARYEAFRNAMGAGQDAEPLVLSGEDVNLLIYHHPDFVTFQGIGKVAMVDDELTTTLSLPTDAMAKLSKKFEGRYLNGEATIRLQLNNGQLEVYLVDLKGAGKSIPDMYLTQLQSENLMQNAQTDPEFEKLLRTLEELKVEDGKLWIVPKPAADRSAP